MGGSSSHQLQKEEEANREQAVRDLAASPLAAKLAELRSTLSEGASLLTPDDKDYMPARCRAYNQAMRGFPLAIARARTVADVAACVRFMRQHGAGTKFCIASGAHSSRCMVTGSFVLDLLHMNAVTLDLDGLTATVEGGAYLEELDKALKPHGLGVPVGTYPQTGVGGLVLAGGFGWLSRLYGFSVDNLLEVEVVLPDGSVVVANDANEHAGLIWGCRGGGGNFGVVTKFVFKLFKLPPHVLGGSKVFLTPTLASAQQVCENFDKLSQETAGETVGLLACVGGAPVVPTMWAHFGDTPDPSAVPALVKANALGGWLQVQNSVKPVSYHSGIQRMTSPLNTTGLLYNSLVQIGRDAELLPASCFRELLSHTRKRLPSSLESAVVIFWRMGGRLADEPTPGRTSIADDVRRARYFCIAETKWKRGAGARGREDARAWCKEVGRLLAPYCRQRLLHAPDAVSDVDGALSDIAAHDLGFSGSTVERLQQVKARYDPTNFFDQNCNILPASDSTKMVRVAPEGAAKAAE